MWLTRHTWTTDIAHDQGSESIDHMLKIYLIMEEYGIEYRTRLLGNKTSNEILEIIHLVLVKIV